MLFENNEYKYAGHLVSPKVVVEIIFYIYGENKKIVSRLDIANEVFDFHIKNNGLSGDSNQIHQVKKALSDINTSFYKKVRTGYYEFLIDEKTKLEDFYKPQRNNRNNYQDTKSINHDLKNISNIDIKDGWVYFYYFPTYKKYAELKNEDFFPVKIGKTKSNPNFRVNEQTGTALPEKPIIFLQVKTNDCSNLEKLIHSTLSLMGKKSSGSVGNEWYISNEKEISNLLLSYTNLGIDIETIKNNNIEDLGNINE